MAIGIHVVHTAFLSINTATNQPVKTSSSTINDVMRTEQRHVVLPDASVPNSAGYPTVPEYLKLEAASNYVVYELNQTTIVTYDAGDVNSAS